MAKTEGQKLVLLYLKDYLERESNEDHPVSAQEFIRYLETKGLSCDRRSIYANIRALQEFGMDIECIKGGNGGYYLNSGTFQTPELKLLVDVVQSARFLTPKKSRELIQKLMKLCNRHDESLLRRQMLVTGQVKSMNEQIYYNIDTIQEAIAAGKKITFRYFDWDIGHKEKMRDKQYVASPYVLRVDNGNYYLLTKSEDREGVTHYRVDRMKRIEVMDEPRTPCPELTGESLKQYGKRVFQMFAGEKKTVRLRMHKSLTNVIYDQFGEDIMLVPDGDEHVIFAAEVDVAPTFLSWVIEFGKKAQILSPESVREKCRALCRSYLEQDEEQN